MGKYCTVCSHPQRGEIEKMVLEGAGSVPQIAKRFDLGKGALQRHKQYHMSERMLKAIATEEVEEAKAGVNLLDELGELITTTKEILRGAQEDGHRRLSLEATRELRNHYDLLLKLQSMVYEYRKENEATSKEDIIAEYEQEKTEEAVERLKILTPQERSVYQMLLVKLHLQDQFLKTGAEDLVSDVDPLPEEEEKKDPPRQTMRRVKKT